MINLFVNYYEEQKAERRKEFDLCMRRNSSNPIINFIPLESPNRIKYSEFFKTINSYTTDVDINIISNLDIYLDETISLVQNMNHNEAFALGRWDINKQGTVQFHERVDSQDTWVFKGTIRNINGDFCLGYVGCDNRIAHEMCVAGYKVSNPSRTIKAFHVHGSGIRNYKLTKNNRKQIEVPPPYRTIPPTEWSNR
jgi:hypothetical protein